MNYNLESTSERLSVEEPVSVEDIGFLRQYIQTLQRKCKQLERQQDMSSHIVADLTSALEEQRVMELLQQRELYAYRTYSEFRDAAVQLHLTHRRKVQRSTSPALFSPAKSIGGSSGEAAGATATGSVGPSSPNGERSDRAAMVHAAVLKDLQQREKKLKTQVTSLTAEVERLRALQLRAQEKEADSSSETVRMLTEQIHRRDGMIRSLMEKNALLSSKIVQSPINMSARNDLASASRSQLDEREKNALQEFRKFLPTASSSPSEDPHHSSSPISQQHLQHVATALASRGTAPFTIQVTGRSGLGHAAAPLTNHPQSHIHGTASKELPVALGHQHDAGRQTPGFTSFGRPKLEITTREDPLRANRRAAEFSHSGLNLDG
jgi:hypothetical protein